MCLFAKYVFINQHINDIADHGKALKCLKRTEETSNMESEEEGPHKCKKLQIQSDSEMGKKMITLFVARIIVE